ncbi:uncharacterized protein LOC143033322 isoform X2 [Oratosquilla oratoria]
MLDVVNVKEHEVLPHPLCLLRVTGASNSDKIAIILNKSESNANATTWAIHEGSFNALIMLKKGRNQLHISCGQEKIVHEVEYQPLINKRYVRLIYITCMNEDKFQGPRDMERSPNTAVKKIRTGAQLLQTFIAETLASEGLGRHTIRLERDSEGNPKVYTIELPLTIRECHKLSEEKLWETVALQLLSSSMADSNAKYIAFFCGTRYLNPNKTLVKHEKEIVAMTKGHVSLGGGGLALVGTGALYSWANNPWDIMDALHSKMPVDTQTLMDFSAGKGTWGASYGTHLGSVLHEMAHTLDLGHTPHGIMARGFEDFHIFFTATSLTSDYLPQSPHHNPAMRQSMSSSLIKESLTFTTDFVRRIPLDNINMVVEPPGEPLASSVVYSPPVALRNNKLPPASSDLMSRTISSSSERLNSPGPIHNTCRTSSGGTLYGFGDFNNKVGGSGIKCRAFWARSSALLLAYHKWLNSNSTDGEIPTLKGSVLCSIGGIRVVELRDMQTMAFHHWEYITRPPPPVLHLPWAQVLHWPRDPHIEVVGMDNHGNLLKGCFIPRPL